MKRRKTETAKKRQKFGPEGLTLWEWKLQFRERHELTKKKRKLYLKQINEKRGEKWGEDIRAPTIE